MSTIVTIGILRERILKELGELLTPMGYKVKDKSGELYFIKKGEFGHIILQFFFYNYYPKDVQVQYQIKVCQNDILKVIVDFYMKIGKSNYALFKENILFNEGDFIDELKNKHVKYRSGFKNTIVSNSDLENLLSLYKELPIRLFDFEKIFGSLSNSYDYLNANIDLISKNCSVILIETLLITSKKINKDLYIKSFDFILKNLSQLNEYGEIAKNVSNEIIELDFYLNNNILSS